jgi:hypothetical protein
MKVRRAGALREMMLHKHDGLKEGRKEAQFSSPASERDAGSAAEEWGSSFASQPLNANNNQSYVSR